MDTQPLSNVQVESPLEQEEQKKSYLIKMLNYMEMEAVLDVSVYPQGSSDTKTLMK